MTTLPSPSPIDISARLQAVTVYFDSARVTRQGVVHLPPGEQVIQIDDLPATIADQSVRAAGHGAGVKLIGVNIEPRYITQEPESAVADLQKQLEALQDAGKSLADEDSLLTDRQQFLNALRDNSSASFAKALARGKASLDHITALIHYLAQELDATQTRRRQLAQRKRELDRQIEAVKSQLERVQQRRPYERRRIQVAVEAAAETDFELDLTYVVNHAGWAPLYDIRLIDDQVALTYLAEVRQQSGEDWASAQLTLSTARPAISTDIPELAPWYIDFFRPPTPPMQTRGTKMMAMAPAPAPAPATSTLNDMLAGAGLREEPPAEAVTAEVESAGAAVSYRITRPADIPSDGSPHKATVAVLDLSAQLDYLTAPKLAEETYLRAKVRNSTPFMLLPGPASIFHGHDFVGTTDLELVAPGGDFELQLGVDDRVKVERKLIERAVSKNLIGNNRRIVWSYRITLANHCPSAARVTVLDQLPTARHEDIKVKLQEALPRPAEQSDLGELKWEVELQPQAKQDITFSFTVEYPRDKTLTGIN